MYACTFGALYRPLHSARRLERPSDYRDLNVISISSHITALYALQHRMQAYLGPGPTVALFAPWGPGVNAFNSESTVLELVLLRLPNLVVFCPFHVSYPCDVKWTDSLIPQNVSRSITDSFIAFPVRNLHSSYGCPFSVLLPIHAEASIFQFTYSRRMLARPDQRMYGLSVQIQVCLSVSLLPSPASY